MIGDIVLIMHPSSAVSRANVTVQNFVSRRYRRSEYHGFSHVAIGSGPAQVFHAMPAPAHVEFALVHEILDPGAVFEVFRNSELEGRLEMDASLHMSLRQEFSKYAGAGYNYGFILRDSEDFAFCSQLIGRLAESLGEAFPKSARWLFPNDIAAHVQANGKQWKRVTDEYRAYIDSSMDYKRLWSNPNAVDARTFRAAHDRAKKHANESEKAFAALLFGLRPKTSLPFVKEGSLTHVSQSVSAPPLQRESGSDPFSYRQSYKDWARMFYVAATQISEQEYDQLIELGTAQGGRTFSTEYPQINPSARSHDAVFVLAEERVAKLASLIFDSVVPMGTDRIPDEVCAWGAPASWRRGSAAMLAAVARRVARDGPISVRVKLGDGSTVRIDPRDPPGAEDASSALVSKLFLSEAVFCDSLLTALAGTVIVGCPTMIHSPLRFTVPIVDADAEVVSARVISIRDAEVIDVDTLSWDDLIRIRNDHQNFDRLRAFRNLLDKSLLAGHPLTQTLVDRAQQEILSVARALRVMTRKISIAVVIAGDTLAIPGVDEGRVHESAGAGARLAIACVPNSLLSLSERLGLLYIVDFQ